MLRSHWTCPLFPQGACRAFPDPQRDELARGPQRNFQILDPLEFLAEFTRPGVPGAPIPPQGAHLIRGHRPKVGRGWYSNKARGMRRKAAEAAEAAAATLEPPAASSSGDAGSVSVRSRSSQTWAMLIKRLYEIDPLACPECGGQMKVVAFLEPRAPERSDGRGT
ncbi:MAG: hypothetical protein MUF25_03930, partial [Pirellulaceae bacterium]|nr:hypothetical protein [Pirellulaceae bacterium]